MSLTNRTLLVFQYLWQNTDEGHPASLADISVFLSEHAIKADPRTLRKDIDQLIEFDLDIVVDRRVQNLYHIASRHLEAPEVKLLIDAVQSAKFITPSKSRRLIERLSSFASPYHTDILSRQLYVDSRSKASNEAVYITVDRVQAAVSTGKKVCFKYFDYTPNKKREYRHEGQIYTASPFALLWNNDTYYMVGFHEAKGIVTKFRIDRMDKLEILNTPAISKPENFNVADYFSQEFSMLHGEACEVTLVCENELINSVIDRFGLDVYTEIVDATHFRVKSVVKLSSNFYGWVFASAGKMKIVSPVKAVDGFKEVLEQYI